MLLTNELVGRGLPPKTGHDFTVHELLTDSTRVVVLQDGNY